MARSLEKAASPHKGRLASLRAFTGNAALFLGRGPLSHRSYAFTGLQSNQIPTASRGTHKSWPIVNQPNAR